MDFESNPYSLDSKGAQAAAETGIATEGCEACRSNPIYCCGPICVANSKVERLRPMPLLHRHKRSRRIVAKKSGLAWRETLPTVGSRR